MLDSFSFPRVGFALLLSSTGLRADGSESIAVLIPEPSADRWMYPSNSTPGTRTTASTFSALPSPASSTGVDDRFGQFIIRFDTVAAGIPAGLGAGNYDISRLVLTAVIAQSNNLPYDGTADPLLSFGPGATADPDAGRPLEIHGTGFRGGFTAATFQETSAFGWGVPGTRNAYALGYDSAGAARDVSSNVTLGFESDAWAIGTIGSLAPGDPIAVYDKVRFEINLGLPGVANYVRQGLHQGFIWLTLSSLHSATEMGSSGFPGYFTRDHPEQALFHDVAPGLEIDYSLPLTITAFNRDSLGNSVHLTWNGSPGFQYRIEGADDLAGGVWSPLGTVTTATPALLTWNGSSASPRAFFRIARSPLP